MSSLSTVEEKLPPGFRFHPKDEELICDYLMKQVMGCALHTPLLIQVDLNKCEPWDIPENARVGDKEWYFYSIRDRKYASGIRTNRATKSGYWKATGKDRPVFRKKTLVGMRKTLVFYEGRAPKGTKTDWVMHEFRLQPGPKTPPSHVKEGDWVLCRVLYKSTSTSTKSEIILGHVPKQETAFSPTSSLSSELNCIKFDHRDHNMMSTQLASAKSNTHGHQQVPCFSNFAPNQTNPTTFSPMISTDNINVDSDSGPYRNTNMTSSSSMAEDKNHVMRGDVWDTSNTYLTKMVNGAASNYYYNLGGSTMKTCPSFGEGSSPFLSQLEFSSIWNHFA